MASHGVARTTRTRTEEQRRQDLDRIGKYRDLQDQVRTQAQQQNYANPALLQLTSKLLRLNPECYTTWNVRRRCLISGSLCRRSAGSSRSRASPSGSASATTNPSSADCSHSSSASTPSSPKSHRAPKGGGSGTAPDDDDASTRQPEATEEEGKHGGDEATDESQTQQDIATLQSELAFTIPLLLESPKCYWIWNQRAWLLSQAIERLPASASRQIWETELGLASKMLTKDRRNFHAWSYRRWVVRTLESPVLGGTSMAQAEFDYTTRMIRVDLSNFSAWHQRSQLVLRVLDEQGADDAARRKFLEAELMLVREGLNVGPEDQSLWYYHQFLMGQILDHVGRATMAPALRGEERLAMAVREIEEIKELLEDYDDVKWVYEALLEYALALQGVRAEAGERNEVEDLKTDAAKWLAKLRTLDPMRSGRWDDLGRTISSC